MLFYISKTSIEREINNSKNKTQWENPNIITVKRCVITGAILETEGSIRKVQKRAFFHHKKTKRAPLI